MEKHLRILQNLISEQKSKMLNRIFFTIALLLIPLLLLVINILTLTIHLVDNPVDLVIFFFFLLSGFIWWALLVIGQNFVGWKTLNQLENQLLVEKLNHDELNQISSWKYFFNRYYKAINQELSFVVKNENFCAFQNQKTLKFQNWKSIIIKLILSFLVVGFFVTECLYFQDFDFQQWTILLGLIVLILYLFLILPFLIIRQIMLNYKYHQFLNQTIDNYQFVFLQRWWLLKGFCEKLEV